MTSSVMFVACCVILAVSAHPELRHHSYEGYEAEANYDFQWGVRNAYYGNDFGQQEKRRGDETQGSYFVDLPDGRTLRVTYYVVGDSGFVADVSYEGEARYSDSSLEPSFEYN